MLFRTLLWLAALIIVVLAGYRLAADQREQLSAIDLLPEGGRFIETTLGRIHAIEAGPATGTPVLLIHGSVGWSGLWADSLAALAAEGYRAIAIDLPPMGLSERSDATEYSRQAQALRILSYVEARGIRPILVVHSFGAGAGAEALLTSPEAFQGAIIIAGALALGQDGSGRALPWPLRSQVVREVLISASVTNPHLIRPLFARFVHRREAITDRQVETLWHPFMRRGTTDTLANWLPSLLVPPRDAASTKTESYASLDVPVALIWGHEDTVTPPDQALALQSALGGAPLFWLSDVGHIPQIEAPGAFHEALEKALSDITRDAGRTE